MTKEQKQGKSTCTKLLWMLQKNTEVTTDVGFKTITKYNDSVKCKIKKTMRGKSNFFKNQPFPKDSTGDDRLSSLLSDADDTFWKSDVSFTSDAKALSTLST